METNEIQDTPQKRAEQRAQMRREERQRKMKMIRNVLNLIFMIMAVVGMVCYFWKDRNVGTIIILVAMAFKMVESSMRMLKL